MSVPLQPAKQPALDAEDAGLRMDQSPVTKGHGQPASISARNSGPVSLTLRPGSKQEGWPGLRDLAFLLGFPAGHEGGGPRRPARRGMNLTTCEGSE